jgi:hypothetical protein
MYASLDEYELLAGHSTRKSHSSHHHHLSMPQLRASPTKPKVPVAAPAVVEAPAAAASSSTSSCSRTYEHLDYKSYIGYCALFSGCRAAVYHPMTIALTRKQGLTDYGSLSTREILRNLTKTEGGTIALSTGLVASVLANSCSEIINSGLFECLRAELPFQSELSRDAAAGYTSDAACRFVYTPLLLVANRQMTQTARLMSADAARSTVPLADNGLRSVVSNVYRTDGPRGFFRGLGATIGVGCTWSAVWWPMYAQSKKMLYATVAPHLPAADSAVGRYLPAWAIDRTDNSLINAAASMITSGSTAVIFNPFLVVRTRVQVDSSPDTSMRKVCRQVYREGGMRGFFKGTTLSVSACVVDGVLAATCYEWAKFLADKTRSPTS